MVFAELFFPKYCLEVWLFRMVDASCFRGLWVFKISKSLSLSYCLWIEPAVQLQPQEEFGVSSQMRIFLVLLFSIFYIFFISDEIFQQCSAERTQSTTTAQNPIGFSKDPSQIQVFIAFIENRPITSNHAKAFRCPAKIT